MYFLSIIGWLVISSNNLYNMLTLCALLSSIFFFYFEGEPGLPGAVGQNGIPGLKVGTKKTKQSHLGMIFHEILSCYNFLYPTGFTWMESLVHSKICYSIKLCD